MCVSCPVQFMHFASSIIDHRPLRTTDSGLVYISYLLSIVMHTHPLIRSQDSSQHRFFRVL